MEYLPVQNFLADVVGAGQAKVVFEELQQSRDAALEKLTNDLAPKKEEIRAAMTFRLVDAKGREQEKSMDERGQEHAIDTFGSVKKGHGFAAGQDTATTNAWAEVLKVVRPAIDSYTQAYKKAHRISDDVVAANDSERKELEQRRADAREAIRRFVEQEVFTPLVREGLIPETFVQDNYSQTQQLLNNTFAAYKLTMQENADAKLLKSATNSADIHGAGGKKAFLAALAGKGGEAGDWVGKKANWTDQKSAWLDVAGNGLATAAALVQTGIAVNRWIPDDAGKQSAIEREKRLLNPEEYRDRVEQRLFDEHEEQTKDDPIRLARSTFLDRSSPATDDELRFILEQQVRQDLLVRNLPRFGISSEDALKIAKAFNALEKDESFYTTASADVLNQIIGEVAEAVGVTLSGLDMTAALAAADRAVAMRKALPKFVQQLDQTLVSGLGSAGNACAGMYLGVVDVAGLHAAMSSGDKGGVDAGEVVELLSGAFVSTFDKLATVVPEAAAPLQQSGQAIAKAFHKAAPFSELKSGSTPPDDVFAHLLQAGREAVQGGLSSEAQTALADPRHLGALVAKSVFPDEQALQDQLDRSDEEIREYERQLTLIDAGGLAVASQKSIDKLIADIKQDRLICQSVVSLGTNLIGIGSGATDIGNWAANEFTDVVAGEVLGPLQAAKLILQLGVNIYQAAERVRLWNKFRDELARSKTAVSSLTSTIQGFYDNKTEQVAFHMVEDALLAVKAAAAVIGSVPTPMTLAVGKTMSTLAGAADAGRKLVESAYNAKQLTAAWTAIKEATKNPGDRALGLQALRLSPTLGMHAIAWAGMSKVPPDVTARSFMAATGLNENTLAAGGTEAKVRDYLVTLLHEDRQTLDPLELNVKWAPESFALKLKDWAVITLRGQSDALPRLRRGDEKPVLAALQQTDLHDLPTLEKQAAVGAISEEDGARFLKEADLLLEALKNYTPVATDNSPHEDMQNLAHQFSSLALRHKSELTRIVDKNRGMRNPERAQQLLATDILELGNYLGIEDPPHDPPPDTPPEVITKLCDRVDAHLREVESIAALAEDPPLRDVLRPDATRLSQGARLWVLAQTRGRSSRSK